MTSKKASKKTERYAIVANEKYGLYCGIVESFDPITRVAVVRECRHVCRWFGRTGGITSLAVHGLCGPRAGESRVGAPSPVATLTGIVNVIECTPAARTTLESAVQS